MFTFQADFFFQAYFFLRGYYYKLEQLSKGNSVWRKINGMLHLSTTFTFFCVETAGSGKLEIVMEIALIEKSF